MNSSMKPWYASRAIWGAVVAILAGALGMAHYTVTPGDQAQIVELLSATASGVGGVIAIYGRVVASNKIGGAKASTNIHLTQISSKLDQLLDQKSGA